MKKVNENKQKYIDAAVAVFATEKRRDEWRKFFNDEISDVVEIDGGKLYAIEKKKIETRFCFGWSSMYPGSSYEDAAKERNNAVNDGGAYFKNENLKSTDKRIDDLSDPRNLIVSYPKYRDGGRSCVVGVTVCYPTEYLQMQDRYGADAVHVLTDAEREKLIDGYRAERARLEKRLDAYLKRYGTSKLHTWTYWMDE